MFCYYSIYSIYSACSDTNKEGFVKSTPFVYGTVSNFNYFKRE